MWSPHDGICALMSGRRNTSEETLVKRYHVKTPCNHLQASKRALTKNQTFCILLIAIRADHVLPAYDLLDHIPNHTGKGLWSHAL